MKKLATILLCIIFAVSIVSSFFLGIIITSKTLVDTEKPNGYIHYFTTQVQSMKIWQNNNATVANDTSTTYGFYVLLYQNNTTGEIETKFLKMVIVNRTSTEVYRSENTSQAIQWTINNAEGRIDFAKGNYTITNSIVISKSNVSLYGYESNFFCNDYPIISVTGNVTNIVISGFWFMTEFKEGDIIHLN